MNINIKDGIDLKIDTSVSEICKTANESSKTTRSVLYLIVFMCVLAFIANWNTRSNSWLKSYSNILSLKHDSIEAEIKNTNIIITSYNLNRDSIYKNVALPDSAKYRNAVESKEFLEHYIKDVDYKREQLVRVHVSNVLRVTLPAIGATFDVNDLPIISGLSFTILLFMFLYISKREYENLCLSFLTITHRYTKYADYDFFKNNMKNLKATFVETERSEEVEDLVIEKINRIRREYHYNYLTMNEVFTLPNLIYNRKRGLIEKMLTFIIFLPAFITHSYILLSDISTYKSGISINPDGTFFGLLFGMAFWILIVVITYHLLDLKSKFIITWDDFYEKNYQFIKSYNYPINKS